MKTCVSGVQHVRGPDDSILTLANLPPADTKRWVVRRKAEVVAAVEGGLLSLENACKRYNISTDEYLSWTRRIETYGVPGLRVSRLQHDRI